MNNLKIDTKEILKNLVKIDAGFDRLVSKEDYNFIESFLLNNNFKKIDYIYDKEENKPSLLAFQINDQNRESEIDLMFLSHIDVVHPGDLNKWKNKNPFDLFEENNILYGRGACDMKGSIAAFLNALQKLNNQNIKYNIGIAVISDEEKKSYGAIAVKNFIKTNNINIFHILIGEPTSDEKLGDICKIGRRGSANFDLKISINDAFGPGHVAYPESFKDPISDILPNIILNLTNYDFNDKNDLFDKTNLVITEVKTNKQYTRNVSASDIDVYFNIRYNNNQNIESLRKILYNILNSSINKDVYNYNLEVFSNFSSFLSKKTNFIEILCDSIKSITSVDPEINTKGGTSDGRFFHDISNLIEFGPSNKSAHKINENINLDDLNNLSEIYYKTMINFNNLFE
jgi:succinyl-diaminopimelate desuccinylase